MAPPSKVAAHGASSFYSMWGQPKNVDPWGEPKERIAAPAKPPGVKQAWEYWGREAQQATTGRSAHVRDKYDDHGDHYTDDESQETYGAEDGRSRQPQSGWYQPQKQSKVTLAHPNSDVGAGTRNALSPQQRSNIMNSLVNALPQNSYGNYVGPQEPPKQKHSQPSQHEQKAKKEEARHPQHGKAKKNKKDQQGGDWGPSGGWDNNETGWGNGGNDYGREVRHPQQGKAKKNNKDQQSSDWGPGGGWDTNGTGWGNGGSDYGREAHHPQRGKAKKNNKDQQSGDWGPGGGWDDNGAGGGNGGSDYGWDDDGRGGQGGERSANRGWGQSSHDHDNTWGQSRSNHDRGWDQSNEGHDKRSKDNRGQSKRGRQSNTDHDTGWGDHGQAGRGADKKRGHDKGWAKSNTGHDTGWGDHEQAGGGVDNSWESANDHWGAANDGWGDTNEHYDWGAAGASGHAGDSKTQVQPTLGGSQPETTYSMPSKTMTHAYNGTHAPPSNAPQTSKMNDYTNIKFVESQGQAFAKVQTAIFGRERKAKDRIHWMFSPDKDERVSALMGWITATEYNLGSYGVSLHDLFVFLRHCYCLQVT